jgi:hypothetical protein
VVEKENSDFAFLPNTVDQSLVNGVPGLGTEPSIPETDLRADFESSIEKVQDANHEKTFQNQSQETHPMDDADPGPFPDSLGDFLFSEFPQSDPNES